VRQAATDTRYPLVINARVDVFLAAAHADGGAGDQDELVAEALRRAHAYLAAGADCVYPILLSAPDALRRFTAQAGGFVNVLRLPQGPAPAELAAMGVARVSWGGLLHGDAMGRFGERLAAIQGQD
jgi:2-methylisocitrate lyase-like PEP mutase family enzyme